METSKISELLVQASSLKPRTLIISDLKWKYLLWAVYRRKNILFVGHTRCGTTSVARAAAEVLQLPFFVFNCGGGQDARATLIGNTVFKKDTGTLFCKSQFVEAIQTKNAIVLLDELTRGSHDFWNILIPTLDSTQRYLRLDEDEHSPVIKVDDSVCFIATSNIGSEYTSTRTLDRAMAARFPVKVEMLPLNRDELLHLIKILYPGLTIDKGSPTWNICDIAHKTITELKKDEPRLSCFIPTGAVLEMAQLIEDGFTLAEIAEMAIYPDYSDEGGVESEKIFIKQIIEGYISKPGAKTPLNDPTNKNK